MPLGSKLTNMIADNFLGFRAHVSLIMSLGGGWKSDVENPKAFELIN